MWITIAVQAAEPVETLVRSSLASEEAWQELVELCDDIGPRLAGSPNLERAVRWAAAKMREDGLQVELQPVRVPRWVRGEERARILAPVDEPLPILGLGMGVSTPPGGVRAEVVVASGWEELASLGDAVRGRIVVFDPPWRGYGATVPFRTQGAARAAEMGAVAVLVRSITDAAWGLPHTGALAEAPIPAAAITPEAAARFRRWAERHRTVSVHLELQSRSEPERWSANVIGELPGARWPEEVVLLGCHLDSWDVGTGAQDDGAGCVAVMEALAQVAALPRRPGRTLRAVLFTNEENGLRGASAYAEKAERRHVAAIETDTGMGGTVGLRVEDFGNGLPPATLGAVERLLDPLRSLGLTRVEAGFSGADLQPLLRAGGGLGLGVLHDTSRYWAIHHTAADTIDKIDPADLRVEVATLAVLAWQLASIETIPGGVP